MRTTTQKNDQRPQSFGGLLEGIGPTETELSISYLLREIVDSFTATLNERITATKSNKLKNKRFKPNKVGLIPS